MPMMGDDDATDPSLDEQDLQIREEIVKVARYHGCTCNLTVHIVRIFPETVGIRVLHDQTCQGLQRQRASEGNN